MADPITGIGLASSILTLAEAGYKISKSTIEFSRLLGELPPDLQECSDLMNVLVRTGKRLQGQLEAEGAGIGPVTAMHADLRPLFNQCNQTASALLSFLDGLQNSNSLSKAIRMARKEGEILKTRNKLDQYILALLFIFEEHQQAFNEDLRNIVEGLRTEFSQFHRKLVEQMRQGFSRVETAIDDSKESLLRDVKPLVAATSEAVHTSNLRLLAGQQDLSQNLHRMEQNFASALQDGGAGLATRFQQQLTEHQAATRTLFQSVYERQNHDIRAQMQLLYQEVTKALGECETAQKRSDVKIPNNHVRIKASFEFEIRSHFVALHISQGIEWVFSTLFLPTVRPSTWLAISVPIPRFDHRHRRCNALDAAVRSAPVNFLIREGTDQYHLIKVDLSEQQYDQDIVKALDKVYSDYRGRWWRWVSSKSILRIDYVKYGSYSKVMQCFTAIEGLNPEDDHWRPVVDPSSMLLHGLKHKHALKDYRTYAPPIHEGYALFIKEGHYDIESTPFIVPFILTVNAVLYNPELRRVAFLLTVASYDLGLYALFIKEGHYITEFISFIVPFILTVITVLYNPELSRVAFVLTAVYGSGLWVSWYFASSRFRLRYALGVTVPMIIVAVQYFTNYEDENLYVIMILKALCPILLWLLDKYHIRVDWKEVRNLVW